MRGSVMSISACLFLALLSGCQEARLRDRTLMQAGTVNDLYYMQALNNLAMMHSNPSLIPYFAQPTQGTNQSQRSLMANYTPGWDFITAKGAFIARWLFDKNTAAFGGTVQNAETWQTAPTTNPDKIYLMKAAYWKTMGQPPDGFDELFSCFLKQYPSPFCGEYANALEPGWYGLGSKMDVPKEACYVGHCGKTYVWVLPENVERLSGFTLAIMNIVTASAKPGGTLFKSIADKTAEQIGRKIAHGLDAQSRLKQIDTDVFASVDSLVKELDIQDDLGLIPSRYAEQIRKVLENELINPMRDKGTVQFLKEKMGEGNVLSRINNILSQIPPHIQPVQEVPLLPMRDTPLSPYPPPPVAPAVP